MEGIQRRTVDHGRLMPQHHLLAIIKAVHDNRASVAQADLEHGLLVLAPPSLDYHGRQQILRNLDYVMIGSSPRTRWHDPRRAREGVRPRGARQGSREGL